MAATRRLSDLYVVGTALSFSDGTPDEDPIEVFIRKLNPVDHETALKIANAARSKMLAIKRNPTDDEYLMLWSQVEGFEQEGLVDYLVEEERVKRTPVVEAEFAGGDEWTKESYLDGLREAWESGISDAYAMNPEDPDAKRVYGEILRFTELVDAEVNARLDDLRDDLERRPLEALQGEVFDKFISMRASLAWLGEYRRCEIWLATRESDRKTRYFPDRDEIDLLPAEVVNRLTDAYRELSVDPVEGKDSRGTEDSSPSSEPPANPETEPASGPEIVTS